MSVQVAWHGGRAGTGVVVGGGQRRVRLRRGGLDVVHVDVAERQIIYVLGDAGPGSGIEDAVPQRDRLDRVVGVPDEVHRVHGGPHPEPVHVNVVHDRVVAVSRSGAVVEVDRHSGGGEGLRLDVLNVDVLDEPAALGVRLQPQPVAEGEAVDPGIPGEQVPYPAGHLAADGHHAVPGQELAVLDDD